MKHLTLSFTLLIFGILANGQTHAVTDTDGNSYSIKSMPDGKTWMTENLNVKVPGSYCYDNHDANCEKYGRLYTWKVAQDVCKLVGKGWRLPTNKDWQNLGKQFGGVRGDSEDGGKSAFSALIPGGEAEFDIQFAGGRNVDSIPVYARQDAHGFYWTATAVDSKYAWMYNFGINGKIMNRHNDIEKGWALAVRCIHD